jgi:hypothetical protein
MILTGRYAYETKDAIMSSNGWYQAFPEDIQDIKKMKMIEALSLGLGSTAGLTMLQTSLAGYIKNLQLRRLRTLVTLFRKRNLTRLQVQYLNF